MLDAFKSFGPGTKGRAHQTMEMQALITSAREERAALTEMLTQVSIRSNKLSQMGKSLEQVDQKASTALERLDELFKRLEQLDQRTRTIEGAEARLQDVLDAVKRAEHAADTIVGPGGELQKQREAIQQLSAQTLETQANIALLKQDQEALQDLRSALHHTHAEVKQSVEDANVLKGDLTKVRAVSGQLAQDYSRIKDASREARDNAEAAIGAVREIETKAGSIIELHELSKNTEERLTALNALAEHVSVKTKALGNQKQVIERAVVEANRLNEMVWAMDMQIARLNEGAKQTANVEETIGRIDKLAQESSARLEAATKQTAEFAREMTRIETDSAALVETICIHVEKLAVEKKAFEAFDQRLGALQTAVAQSEGRMVALAAKDKDVAALNQTIDALSAQFQGVTLQADELTRKQASLELLHDQLAHLNELARKTTSQFDILKQSKYDVDAVRGEIEEFYKDYRDVARLRDKLASDKATLDLFAERVAILDARAPALDAKMNTILDSLALVDEGTQKATRLGEIVVDLDGQIGRVSERVQFVEKIETRLNLLSTLNVEVDRKLQDQLACRAELEMLKSQCDGVSRAMLDAEQKLEAISALQQALLPLTTQHAAVKAELARTTADLKKVARDEASIHEQENRLLNLEASSRELSADVNEKLRQITELSDQLTRSTTVKDEVVIALNEVQRRQRETESRVQASQDQLNDLDTTFAQLARRRAELAVAEKQIAAFDSRITELQQMAAGVDRQIEAIAAREALVSAVKSEVETVHEIGARVKADLQHVADHRAEVAAAKMRADEVLAAIAETEQKLNSIEARRRLVDDVQQKANMVVNLLDDMRINLETLGEQKAIVDNLSEKLARVDFAVQEAQNTLRALHHEREVAERIEGAIRQLRTKSASTSEQTQSAVSSRQ